MDNEQRLTVYRASAGAGKTFTLAVKYIELLIATPRAYRETLAVTFTNKATEEMKTRILSQLYGLSQRPVLKGSESYMQRIVEDMGVGEEVVRQNAGLALEYMLKDYHNVNIMTIDAFFQRILRNLAHELGLSNAMRVELNNDEIESLAVDKLFAELQDNDTELAWINDYIRNNLENDNPENALNSIREFGRKVFSDDYKRYAAQLDVALANEQTFTDYRKYLTNIVQTADRQMRSYHDEFVQLLKQNHMPPTSIAQKPRDYFTALRKGTYVTKNTKLQEICQDIEDHGAKKWLARGNKDNYHEIIAADYLTPLLKRAENERKKLVEAKKVATAKVILDHLDDLRLLRAIDRAVKDLNGGENRVMLSDTQHIIAGMTGDDDISFVFEKIGGRILHTMIDEFQDTSHVQWQNFKKLLTNCMADRRSKNLIVGDVKQSIYRWRGGDWQLLHGIGSDLEAKLETLNTNYRSEANVREFNNTFFVLAAEEEAERMKHNKIPHADVITEIYNEHLVRQLQPAGKSSAGKHGLVDITLLPATAPKDNKEYKYSTACLELVRSHIEDLLAAGAKEKDIAVVCRTNTDINRLATWTESGLNFISDEAYKLDSSAVLSVLIAAMRVVDNEADKISKAVLEGRYAIVSNGKTIDSTTFASHLPTLRSLPLYELAERLYSLLALDSKKGDAPYVHCFMDHLNAFSKNNTPDLTAFLAHWDSTLRNKSIPGGNIDGIRLITIHKSKGLEYKHVIVPFCDWDLEKGSDLWCPRKDSEKQATSGEKQGVSDNASGEKQGTSENASGEKQGVDGDIMGNLPVVPVNTLRMENTIFQDELQNEQLQTAVDNLNMLYVAFTRAAQNLFVIGKNAISATNDITKSNSRAALLQVLLDKVADKMNGSFTGNKEDRQSELHFQLGSIYVPKPKEETAKETDKQADKAAANQAVNQAYKEAANQSDKAAVKSNQLEDTRLNVFTAKETPVEVETACVAYDDNESKLTPKVEFLPSNSSRQFVQGEVSARSMGTILHDLLARIDDEPSVERVLKVFISDTRLPRATAIAKADMIRQSIASLHGTPYEYWFSQEATVFNECSVLRRNEQTGATESDRPDRVVSYQGRLTVIDYKFGERRASYHNQVKRYMHLLQAMGYDNVDGYLWYFNDHGAAGIERVN